MGFLIVLELILTTFASWLRDWCHMPKCCNTLLLQVWSQSAAQITVWGPTCLMLDTGIIRYTVWSCPLLIQNYTSGSRIIAVLNWCCVGFHAVRGGANSAKRRSAANKGVSGD